MRSLILAVGAAAMLVAAQTAAASDISDRGLHTQSWFKHDSFLTLADDLEEARENGKGLAVFVEQEGCGYCEKIHKEVLADDWVADYVRDNFDVIQINLFGDLEIEDLDGEALTEKEAGRRWSVLFTPTIMLFDKDGAVPEDATAREAAVAVMPGAFGKLTFRDLFEWVATGAYKDEPSFQRFHMEKLDEHRADGRL